MDMISTPPGACAQPPIKHLPAGHPAGLVVTSALIIWKSLMLWTGSESPVSCSQA